MRPRSPGVDPYWARFSRYLQIILCPRYWDWASNDTRSRIPDAVAAPTINVVRPGSNGTESISSIANPLYNYKFAAIHADGVCYLPHFMWSSHYIPTYAKVFRVLKPLPYVAVMPTPY